MKTSELTGAALNWAVAKCEFPNAFAQDTEVLVLPRFQPSTNWAQGGPIIEREGISVMRNDTYFGFDGWVASVTVLSRDAQGLNPYMSERGNTPLVAAMRCYVASKLGDTVDVPKELAT